MTKTYASRVNHVRTNFRKFDSADILVARHGKFGNEWCISRISKVISDCYEIAAGFPVSCYSYSANRCE